MKTIHLCLGVAHWGSKCNAFSPMLHEPITPSEKSRLLKLRPLRACARLRKRETPTYSQQGLVVVNVFGGKRGTHADGERWQRQTRKQASQQELQLDLLLV